MGHEAHGYDVATTAIRAGQYQDVSDQHSEPLVLTSSYVFDDAEDAAEKFSGRRPGNVYVRFTNPTVAAFEQRIAAMEGAQAGAAMSSGMACYAAIAMAFLSAGDHVLLARGMFGTTTHLHKHYLSRFGVETSLADVQDVESWGDLVRPSTKMMVVETPTNPMMHVADLSKLSAIARDRGIMLVVDNTLCTPIFQRPHMHGADLIVHSAAKYIDGQGRCGGGVVVGRKELVTPLIEVLRTLGPSLSPFNAWVFTKSLETLPLRMKQHDYNARMLAKWLCENKHVERVFFTGLADHPQASIIAAQQTGHGGLVSFTLRGGRAEAWRIIDRLQLISVTTNIGDAKTMITHPATTTHGRLRDEDKRAAGISDSLLRISVGLEHIDDIVADLDRAFGS